MKPARTLIASCLAALLALGASFPARAAEDAPVAAPAQSLDPALRALLMGIAASVLRGMTAHPAEGAADPGAAIERSLQQLLADPRTEQMLDALLEQASRDMPQELRAPFAALLRSLIADMRNGLLRDAPPRGMLRTGAGS